MAAKGRVVEKINRWIFGKKAVIFLAVAVITYISMREVFKRVAVATSESLPYRIFLLESPRPAKGGYVLFNHKDRHVTGRIIKRVSCVAGERLETRGRDYYCNGTYLGRAKEFGRKGQKLSNFTFNGIVPDDRMFVTSDHLDSYDSRYWGFLSKEEVMASAQPLF